MKKVCLAALCVLLLTAARTTTLKVTFQTDPPGAALIQDDGKLLGYAPVTLNYKMETPRASLKGVTAKWASGAVASVPSITAELANGKNQQFTFQRPDVPGREADVQVALQLAELSLARRQMTVAALAAWNARQQQVYQQQADIARAQIASRPVNCYSQVIGNAIQTSCR